MTDQDNDPASPTEDRNTMTLAEKVKAIQEQARQKSFILDGSSDKQIMDEAWGEHDTTPECPKNKSIPKNNHMAKNERFTGKARMVRKEKI